MKISRKTLPHFNILVYRNCLSSLVKYTVDSHIAIRVHGLISPKQLKIQSTIFHQTSLREQINVGLTRRLTQFSNGTWRTVDCLILLRETTSSYCGRQPSVCSTSPQQIAQQSLISTNSMQLKFELCFWIFTILKFSVFGLVTNN